jgi:hypothetical protein
MPCCRFPGRLCAASADAAADAAADAPGRLCVIAVDAPPAAAAAAAAFLAACVLPLPMLLPMLLPMPLAALCYLVVVVVFLVTSCAHAQTEVLMVKSPTAHFGGCDSL